MTTLVTAEQVRDYLSNPPWTASQEATCRQLIARREAELARWLGWGLPLTPTDRAETARILKSGLIATSAPVYQVHEIAGVPVADGVFGAELPEPYVWRYEGWVSVPEDTAIPGYITRPFSITDGFRGVRSVLMRYAAGWGPAADIVGAVVMKVAATMENRHSDTVVARAMDAKEPSPLKEEWTEDELKMLSSRRRPWGRS